MAGFATKVRGQMLNLSTPGNYHSYVLREPMGVVGQIIPWNFPLLMAAWKLAPTLAVGCTVVLKPAEDAWGGRLLDAARRPDAAMTTADQPFIFLTSGKLASQRSTPPVLAGKPPPRLRAKPWELSDSVHRSIVGTCLTTGALRRVMAKAITADVSHLSDHDLHSRAVGLRGQRSASSRLLQGARPPARDGDQALRPAAGRGGGDAGLGRSARRRRHPRRLLGGAHPPRCRARRAFGNVHMLSHLVGTANRADIRRLTALEAENAALLANLEARLDRETGRRERLEQRTADAPKAARLWERRAREAEAGRAAMRQELAALERKAPGTAEAATGLPAERILCVGGQPGCTEQMRASLEAAGGALLCHDGGRHGHPFLCCPGWSAKPTAWPFPWTA